MKSKTLLIAVVIIVILVVLYFVYQSTNKNKTTLTTTSTNTTPVLNTSVTPSIKRQAVVYNPYPQSYLDSFPNQQLIRANSNPQLMRMNKAIAAAKTYVFECRKKNADGTLTVTTGYSSNSSGNCGTGFTESLIKTLD